MKGNYDENISITKCTDINNQVFIKYLLNKTAHYWNVYNGAYFFYFYIKYYKHYQKRSYKARCAVTSNKINKCIKKNYKINRTCITSDFTPPLTKM